MPRVSDGIRLAETDECSRAGVLARSLAISEAFQLVRAEIHWLDGRVVVLSFCGPGSVTPWYEVTDSGPTLEILPSHLWLIGFEHLGQAHLWTPGLTLCVYERGATSSPGERGGSNPIRPPQRRGLVRDDLIMQINGKYVAVELQHQAIR